MRRNGGIIGPKQEPSASAPGDVKIFDNHDRHIRGTGSWPRVKEITSMTQTAPNTGSVATVYQNDIATFTVSGLGFDGGAETYYWTIDKTASNYPDSWDIFTALNGSFTMTTSNSGTFNIQTNFAPDKEYASGSFQKLFRIQIRSGSTSGPVVLTSTTLYVLNWTIPSTWEGFQNTQESELGTNTGVLRFKIEDVGTAGSANGALRFLWPIFLEKTSSNGIHLNGGYGGQGTQEQYQAESSNSGAGSTGEMIFTVRGTAGRTHYYSIKGNNNASSQARLYADTGAGWSQLATSNNTTPVTGTYYLHHGDRLKFEFYNDGGGFSDGRGELVYLYQAGGSVNLHSPGVASMSSSNAAGVADIYGIQYSSNTTLNLPNVIGGSGYTDNFYTDYDLTTEGSETGHLQINMYGSVKARESTGATNRACWTQVSADQIEILDVSNDPNISTNEPSSITEGTSTQITVTNTGETTPGTLYYQVAGSGVNNNDFLNFLTSGSIAMSTSGSNTVGTLTLDPVAEGGTAENEQFEIQIKKNSTSGPTLHTTNNITITDVVPTTKELRLLWREVRYGTNIGSLNVYIANPTTGATISNSLYSASGNLGTTTWNQVVTNPYTANVGDQYRWLFYYQDGNYWRSDWAIDNVAYTKDNVVQWTENFDGSGTYGGATTTGDWLTGPAAQNANASVATGWSDKSTLVDPSGNPPAYTNKWYIHSGSTPSSSTGPTGAYTGTYYCYPECSGGTFSRDYYLWSPIFTV